MEQNGMEELMNKIEYFLENGSWGVNTLHRKLKNQWYVWLWRAKKWNTFEWSVEPIFLKKISKLEAKKQFPEAFSIEVQYFIYDVGSGDCRGSNTLTRKCGKQYSFWNDGIRKWIDKKAPSDFWLDEISLNEAKEHYPEAFGLKPKKIEHKTVQPTQLDRIEKMLTELLNRKTMKFTEA